MSFNNLENCVRCGEVFVHISRNICPQCVKKVEQEFKLCSQFLRKKENRTSTITEMSEKTGVSVPQITEFIREKRLIIDPTSNIEYPCESCGAMIRSNRLCLHCANYISEGLDTKVQEKEEKKNSSSYHIDGHKKW